MIIPDANLLVYSYNPRAIQHAASRAWLEGLLGGREEIGLHWVVIMAFIRLITNPRIVTPAVPVNDAVAAVESWLKLDHVRIIESGPRHADVLFSLLRETGAAGNLTTDAQIAALSMEYQAVVHTNDPDFLRFSGCRWVNPLAR